LCGNAIIELLLELATLIFELKKAALSILREVVARIPMLGKGHIR
jgi:hypothetical protein